MAGVGDEDGTRIDRDGDPGGSDRGQTRALLDWAAKEKRPADKAARSAYALLLTQAGLCR
jgi:hypothetical protein